MWCDAPWYVLHRVSVGSACREGSYQRIWLWADGCQRSLRASTDMSVTTNVFLQRPRGSRPDQTTNRCYFNVRIRQNHKFHSSDCLGARSISYSYLTQHDNTSGYEIPSQVGDSVGQETGGLIAFTVNHTRLTLTSTTLESLKSQKLFSPLQTATGFHLSPHGIKINSQTFKTIPSITGRTVSSVKILFFSMN